MEQLTKWLLDLSACTGVSGKESAVADWLEERMSPYGSCTRTPLGSLCCTLREPVPGKPHLLAVAHMDEVGFVVTHIGEHGFLRVACIGGVDRKLYPATPVEIHTKDGVVSAVFCSTPPHLQTRGEKSLPAAEDMWVDTGLGEKAKERISLGDHVTLQNLPKTLLGGWVSGKGLDDRACCAALLRTAQLLGDESVDCGVTFVFSTMEEIGSQGAKTAAWRVAPTHGVALDVSFAYSPGCKKEDCGELDKGPMIGMAPILDTVGTNRLLALAKELDIPYQVEVMAGSTGTDADGLAVTREGVRTVLVSIPQRYMHSPAEVVSPADVEHTAELLTAYLRNLGREEDVK